MEIVTKNAEETADFGKKIAISLKGGEILALVGELGSGKTTFTQGLATALGVEGKIISPTFILQKVYHLTSGGSLFHIDLYRLEENFAGELKNLGVEDFWQKNNNIFVIEWADKAEELLPKGTIFIYFKHDGDKRIITTERK